METNINILDANFEQLTDMLGDLHAKREKMILNEIQKQKEQIAKEQLRIAKTIVKDIKLNIEQNTEIEDLLIKNREYRTAIGIISKIIFSTDPNDIKDVRFINDMHLKFTVRDVVSQYIIENYGTLIKQARASNDQSNLQNLLPIYKLELEYRNLGRSKTIAGFDAPSVEEALSSNPDYAKFHDRVARLEEIILLIGRKNNLWLNRSAGSKDTHVQTDLTLDNMKEGLGNQLS